MAILFTVMLVAAAGNTAMQSTLPSIASTLDLPDVLVSLAFSWSALLWVITAPKWARMSDRQGRKKLMTIGLLGFTTSMGLCGLVLWFGLHGLIAPLTTFIIFALFRSVYGGVGSASPPAVQAYVAARTDGAERTKALSLLASSFGLGTVIGPALAPIMVLEPFGLAGPMIFFCVFGIVVFIFLRLLLPSDTPRYAARGRVSSYPSSASVEQPDIDGENDDGDLPQGEVRLRWRDPRLFPWLTSGLVGAHAQALLLGVVGYMIRDRMGLQNDTSAAVQAIGSVLFIGAMATLLAQWGLIPILKLKPKTLIVSGSSLALIGVVLTGISHNLYGISIGYAIASMGFGLYRPGFMAGSSLAVERHEQGDVAGKVASTNGAAFILAPTIGVGLFNIWEASTFALIAAALVFLIIWGSKALKD